MTRSFTQEELEKWLNGITIFSAVISAGPNFDNIDVSELSSVIRHSYEIYDRSMDIANKGHDIAKSNLDDPKIQVPCAILILAYFKEIEKILRSNEKIASIAAQVGL